MTGDEFTARYRLRAQLNDGDVVSYRAADGRGGYALVHVFRGEPAPEFDEGTLGPEGKEELREVLEVEGIRVVVTEVVDPFTSFEAWYADRQRGPETEEPGAFTRIFRVQAEPEETEEAEASPPAPEEAPAEEESTDAPGEFTRLFGSMQTPPTADRLARPRAARSTDSPPFGPHARAPRGRPARRDASGSAATPGPAALRLRRRSGTPGQAAGAAGPARDDAEHGHVHADHAWEAGPGWRVRSAAAPAPAAGRTVPARGASSASAPTRGLAAGVRAAPAADGEAAGRAAAAALPTAGGAAAAAAGAAHLAAAVAGGWCLTRALHARDARVPWTGTARPASDPRGVRGRRPRDGRLRRWLGKLPGSVAGEG